MKSFRVLLKTSLFHFLLAVNYLKRVKLKNNVSQDFPGGAMSIRIRLPMQGTQVQSLVWEDSTCPRATKPMCHNYWYHALEPKSCNYWSLSAYSLCSTVRETTATRNSSTATKSSPHSLQEEKSPSKATKTQHSQKLIKKVNLLTTDSAIYHVTKCLLAMCSCKYTYVYVCFLTL